MTFSNSLLSLLAGEKIAFIQGFTYLPLSVMNSQLSRCSTARGSSTGLSLVGPTKVKARKSFIFPEGSLKVENSIVLFT